MSILATYKKSGFVPFSLNISWNETKQKKELKNVPSFASIESYDKIHIKSKYNACGLRTGMKLPTLKTDKIDYYLIALDIDNKQDDNKLNGLTKWTEIITNNNFQSITDIKTPIQQTQSGGYHYLFKVSAEQLAINGASITDLTIDEQKYSIDLKATNQFIFVEPTKINDTRFYKWIQSPATVPIMILPNFIYNLILNHKKTLKSHNKSTIKQPKSITTNATQGSWSGNNNTISSKINELEETPQISSLLLSSNQTNNVLKLLDLIDVKRFDNYTEWIKLGAIIKFCNLPFELFDSKSQTSSKYDKHETVKNGIVLQNQAKLILMKPD